MTTHILPRRWLTAKSRRWSRLPRRAFVLLLALVLVAVVWFQREHLQRISFTTGYCLLAAILALISLHWRKQAPSLPLGKVSVWLQYHINLGSLTILLFGIHVGFRLPTGVLETALFVVFSIVAGSGLYGLYITRTIPQQLRRLPEEVIYERIPMQRRRLAAEARQLVLDGSSGESSVLAEFYRSTLMAFFEQPRGLGYLLRPSSQRRHYLLAQLHELHRFLDPRQRNICAQLEQLIGRKDDLDFHAALQGRLKLWMYVHVAFSYSLLMLGTVHGLVAHAFRGGAQ